ncbi:MAG: hypothetical protein Q8Q62_00545 [Mesorhizobium sp.]|nr:hypothetical protein [Mesorhizobium sp.]
MNASPITVWEGATAYFTFADSPLILSVVLVGAIAACVYAIVSMAQHETASSKKFKAK